VNILAPTINNPANKVDNMYGLIIISAMEVYILSCRCSKPAMQVYIMNTRSVIPAMQIYILKF
jgi:hypothetical protein